MPLSPALLRLYRRADYVVANRPPMRIGRRAPVAGETLAGDAVLLTAANPRSRRMPSGWNARMNRALADAARRLRPLPAEGRLGAWREEGFLLEAAPARAAALGRRFRQNAVVVVKGGQPVRLMLLR